MGATSSRVTERAAFFSGQKSGLPPKTLKASDSEVLTNFLVKNGTLVQQYGDSTYGTVSGSGRVYMLDVYNNVILAQRGGELYEESSEGSASFSSIAAGLNNVIPQRDRYRNEFYFVNGIDQKVYKGSGNLRNLGLNGPIATTAQLSTAGWTKATSGALDDDSTYKVTFTLFDPVNNVESPAINVRPNSYGLCTDLTPGYFTVTLAATEDEFIIPASAITAILANTFNSTTLVDSARGTHVRVYMSASSNSVNANVFRLISTYAVASLGNISVTAEATGILLPTNNVPPLNILRQQEAYAYVSNSNVFTSTYTIPVDVASSVYKSIRFFRDSMFGFGAAGTQFDSTTTTTRKSYNSVLYIHEPFQPDYVYDTREVGAGDEQNATGVATLRDSVILCFKEKSIYYVSGSSVDSYIVRVMDTRRGAVTAATIQETPYGVFALDQSGVIQVSQVGPAVKISDDIEDIIDRISWGAVSSIYSSYDTKEDRYYLALPVDGADTPNLTVVYKCDEKAWSIIQGQEGTAALFTRSSARSVKNLVAQISGRIANTSSETAVTANGAALEAQYLSGPFFGEDPTRKKKAKFVYITAETNTDFTIDLEVVPDFGQSPSHSLSDINSTSIYSIWASSLSDTTTGVGVWDSSYWSGSKVRKQLKIPVSSIGYSFQIRITNNSTDTDQYGFRILAVELEMSIMGK